MLIVIYGGTAVVSATYYGLRVVCGSVPNADLYNYEFLIEAADWKWNHWVAHCTLNFKQSNGFADDL